MLLARSRAEDAAKSKLSTIRKKLRKLEEELRKVREGLEEAVEEVSSLLEEAGNITGTRHRLSGRIEEEREHLEGIYGEAISLIQESTEIFLRAARRIEQVKRAADSADRALKLGLVDEALSTSVEALGDLSSLEEYLRPTILRMRDQISRLRTGEEVLRKLLEDVKRDIGLLMSLNVDVAGEEVRLIKACGLEGFGNGILLLTDKKLLFLDRSGREILKIPRASIEVRGISKGFLGLRRKLILSTKGVEELAELVISCNRHDLKAIEEELRRGPRSLEA